MDRCGRFLANILRSSIGKEWKDWDQVSLRPYTTKPHEVVIFIETIILILFSLNPTLPPLASSLLLPFTQLHESHLASPHYTCPHSSDMFSDHVSIHFAAFSTCTPGNLHIEPVPHSLTKFLIPSFSLLLNFRVTRRSIFCNMRVYWRNIPLKFQSRMVDHFLSFHLHSSDVCCHLQYPFSRRQDFASGFQLE